MAEVATNFGETTLAEALDDSETTVTVADGDVFPATGTFRVVVDDEIMVVSARSGNDLTVTRGGESTAAVAHDFGADIKLMLTVASLLAFIADRKELLGLAAYEPGSDSAIATTVSATSADVDATNLQVAFTVPASGAVLVRFTAMMSGAIGGADYWQVRESTTVLQDGLVEQAADLGRSRSIALRVAGLTPGAAKTYKWGFRTSGATHSIYGGPTFGQAVMEVWAAP